MGQKVNPHGARVGVIYDWSTRWYAGKKDFANNLVEDFKLRKMLKEKYYSTGISHIDIERTAQTMTVNIFTAKPGMIIGRGGAGIEELKKKPVDDPTSVINNGGGKGEEEENDFLSSLAEAQKISKLLG